MLLTLDATGEPAYRYLWLKYVTGVDLDRHCARCLRGRYSARVNRELAKSRVLTVPLDEVANPDVVYLCGVTARWAGNLHLAFEHAPGMVLHHAWQHVTVTVTDARRLPIGAQAIDPTHRFAEVSEYATCRNWQFAHSLVGRPPQPRSSA